MIKLLNPQQKLLRIFYLKLIFSQFMKKIKKALLVLFSLVLIIALGVYFYLLSTKPQYEGEIAIKNIYNIQLLMFYFLSRRGCSCQKSSEFNHQLTIRIIAMSAGTVSCGCQLTAVPLEQNLYPFDIGFGFGIRRDPSIFLHSARACIVCRTCQ